jgi:hypothetical protein
VVQGTRQQKLGVTFWRCPARRYWRATVNDAMQLFN